LGLLPSSGKKYRTETLAVGPPGPGLRLAEPARVSVLYFLPEDGRRPNFRNVVNFNFLLKHRRWTKSKKQFFQEIVYLHVIVKKR
jgi:hypothetical protein